MPTVAVDGLDFEFPSTWMVSKYDEWTFYRKQFSRVRDGLKALDLLAVDPEGTAWLIEVKDYRGHVRTKPSALDDEVAGKVLDTLAALLPAKVNANDAQEAEMAAAVLGAKKLRVVLHLEQPEKHSTLRPRAINPADVQQALRRRLKPIDAHPLVAETSRMGSLAWKVT
ncbi:hypothetical protein WMF31_31250 [Sorangium sp. So ce1036]|uniref:hypothetical protein n=1 Tax=Sorangium sp. So ce1036 TaxID=3133328 RepID=UPI003F11CBE6